MLAKLLSRSCGRHTHRLFSTLAQPTQHSIPKNILNQSAILSNLQNNPPQIHNLKDNSLIIYHPSSIPYDQSNALYDHLLSSMAFEQASLKLYNKHVKTPRLQSWMADEGITNKEAHLFQKQPSQPWSPDMIHSSSHMHDITSEKNRNVCPYARIKVVSHIRVHVGKNVSCVYHQKYN